MFLAFKERKSWKGIHARDALRKEFQGRKSTKSVTQKGSL